MRLLLLALGALLSGQSIQLDTQALAARLKSVRTYKHLPARDFQEIQGGAIAWIDKRFRANAPIAGMNSELKAAGIIEPDKPEFKEDDDVMVNYTGYLSQIATIPVPGADELLALNLGIGLMCGYDQTILLYRREPLRLIGRLDHHDPKFQFGYGYSSLLAAKTGSDLIVASGTYSEWCTSTLISVNLHIDRIEGAHVHNLLSQSESARCWGDPDKLVQIFIDHHVVTFLYTADLGDDQLMARPAIARYSVLANTVKRLTPIALSRIGFIDEWLDIAGREAEQWSTPEAMRARPEVKDWFKDQAMHLDGISRCPGSPAIWQVAIRRLKLHNEPTKQFFFSMTESGASQMRMLAVEKQPLTGCNPANFQRLAEELPR